MPYIGALLEIPLESELRFVAIDQTDPVDIVINQKISCPTTPFPKENYTISTGFDQDMTIGVEAYPAKIIQCDNNSYTIRLYKDFELGIDYEPSINISMQAFTANELYYDQPGSANILLKSHISESKNTDIQLLRDDIIINSTTISLSNGEEQYITLKFT